VPVGTLSLQAIRNTDLGYDGAGTGTGAGAGSTEGDESSALDWQVEGEAQLLELIAAHGGGSAAGGDGSATAAAGSGGGGPGDGDAWKRGEGGGAGWVRWWTRYGARGRGRGGLVVRHAVSPSGRPAQLTTPLVRLTKSPRSSVVLRALRSTGGALDADRAGAVGCRR
jgi:hypothetical protein